MNWIKQLFGLGEIAGEYLKERQQLKNALKLAKLQGKIDLTAAKFQAQAAQQQHIQSWEMASLNIHARGYKDDVVMFVVLAPIVGVFIPVIQDYILTGFEYLAKMPYWYVGLAITICLAIYGIRHKNASKIQAPGLRDEDVEEKV